MNINKKLEPRPGKLDKHLTNGLTREEAVRFAQISHHPSRNGSREHREVSERLFKFRETLRLVQPTGLDELALAVDRKEQWRIVEHYVFRQVIVDLSRSDTIALAEYALWVFHGMEVRPAVEPPPSKDTFGSLEGVFGGIVFDK